MPLIWVTGARGFLGRHVVQRFAAAGWNVAGLGLGGGADVAVDQLPLMRVDGRPAWIESAVNASALVSLLRLTGKPDAVFHAAGAGAVGPSFSDPVRDFRMSVETTLVVLELLRRSAPEAIFVLPSSSAVYGMVGAGPIEEEEPCRPVSPYGVHKVCAELVCRSMASNFGLRIAAIRYFSLYGPGLRKQLLWDLSGKLAAADREIVLSGDGGETRDMFHVADAAELAWRAVAAAPTDYTVVNGGSGRASTVRDISEGLAAAFGRRVRLCFDGKIRDGDPRHLQASTERAAKLDFVSTWPLERGLASYAQWWREIHLDGAVQ